MAAKPFDVVIFGATGFTGRQAVTAMLHRAATQPLRWAVAGRSTDRLDALLTRHLPAAVERPGVLVADATDTESLHALAAKTSVLRGTKKADTQAA